MNERIRELAKQAQDNGDAIHYYDPVFAEKFAELIVRECARICVKEARQLGGRVCSDKIKDHFGVKE